MVKKGHIICLFSGIVLLAGSALANSQELSTVAASGIGGYGVQTPANNGVDISDVLLSLKSSGRQGMYIPPHSNDLQTVNVDSAAIQNSNIQNLNFIPPPAETFLKPPPEAEACGKKVEVNFKDAEYFVLTPSMYANMSAYQHMDNRQSMSGTSRDRGIEYEIKLIENGCAQKMQINLFRVEPIQVMLPDRKSEDDCMWIKSYHHSMEQVRIMQTTPKSFEADVKLIAERSTNPSSEMVRLVWRINEETNRRIGEFKNFEKRLPKGCKLGFNGKRW